MSNGHILPKTSHHCHFIGMNGMDDATCTKEKASLEHGMGEEVEHSGHISKLRMVVEHHSILMRRQANAKSHHHKGYL